MPLFLIRPTNENYEITHERKFWTHEIPTEKIWNPRNTHEKISKSPKIQTLKNFRPTKYPRRQDGTMALDPRDPRWHATHEI